jgi:hypothetical protein
LNQLVVQIRNSEADLQRMQQQQHLQQLQQQQAALSAHMQHQRAHSALPFDPLPLAAAHPWPNAANARGPSPALTVPLPSFSPPPPSSHGSTLVGPSASAALSVSHSGEAAAVSPPTGLHARTGSLSRNNPFGALGQAIDNVLAKSNQPQQYAQMQSQIQPQPLPLQQTAVHAQMHYWQPQVQLPQPTHSLLTHVQPGNHSRSSSASVGGRSMNGAAPAAHPTAFLSLVSLPVAAALPSPSSVCPVVQPPPLSLLFWHAQLQ